MPKKANPAKDRPLYRRKPPRPESLGQNLQNPQNKNPQSGFRNPQFIAPAHFELREDGSVVGQASRLSPSSVAESGKSETGATPVLRFRSDSPFVRLYHGNCLELLDAIAARYPEGRFDAIFADPPYFLSNGGITCHAGKMVKADT